MTDSEIIKALKEWSERGFTFCNVGMPEFSRSILSLINRQKEEIKELNQMYAKLVDENDARDIDEFNLMCRVRIDARREFVEMLKERALQSTMDNRICSFNMIDNLLKEMESESK